MVPVILDSVLLSLLSEELLPDSSESFLVALDTWSAADSSEDASFEVSFEAASEAAPEALDSEEASDASEVTAADAEVATVLVLELHAVAAAAIAASANIVNKALCFINSTSKYPVFS